MPLTCEDVLRIQEDDHSPSTTPVLAALGPAGRAGDVKGDGGNVGGDGAGVLAVDRVVLHEPARVVEGEEGVADDHGYDVGFVFEGSVTNKAVETIYFNLDSCG